MERQDFCGDGWVCAACGEAEGWLRSSPPHTRPISFNQAERRAALSSGSLSSLSARSTSVTCTCAPLRIITWVQPPCRTAEELSRAALQHTLVALSVHREHTYLHLPFSKRFLLIYANILYLFFFFTFTSIVDKNDGLEDILSDS